MIRRLFWDIETSPNIGMFWRSGYQIDVGHDAIINERKIITIAWKWAGEKKVHSLHWDEDQDDKAMLLAFLPVLNESDEAVAHFGDRFDLPWFKTRCLVHRISTFPSNKTIDTKAWASKNFYFNSNKLDYIARLLGYGGKLKTDYALWKKITLHNDRKALAYMVKYNKIDVVRLEQVFNRFAEVVPHKTHAGVAEGYEKWSCAHCANHDANKVKVNKTIVTAMGTKQYQMMCRACSKYYKISQAAHNALTEERIRIELAEKSGPK